MRLLIAADLHSNLEATLAVARQEADRCDAIVCLGDLVDYGPCPAECIEWTLGHARWHVRGNHDEAVAAWDPQKDGDARDYDLANRAMNRRLIRDAQAAALLAMPLAAAFEFGGAKFLAVHGSVSDPLTGSLKPQTPSAAFERELASTDADVVLAGHTHIPLVRTVGPRTWVNAGSIGQPRDGNPAAQYAVWDDGRIELKRAAFDVEATIRHLARRSLPEPYLSWLANGWRCGLQPKPESLR